MKSIFIILGNGFTIDFLTHYNKYNVNNPTKQHSIDVTNLMMNGEKSLHHGIKNLDFFLIKIVLHCGRWGRDHINPQVKVFL